MTPPGSFVHGILQARILEWVAMPSSRGSSNPGLNPGLLHTRIHPPNALPKHVCVCIGGVCVCVYVCEGAGILSPGTISQKSGVVGLFFCPPSNGLPSSGADSSLTDITPPLPLVPMGREN